MHGLDNIFSTLTSYFLFGRIRPSPTESRNRCHERFSYAGIICAVSDIVVLWVHLERFESNFSRNCTHFGLSCAGRICAVVNIVDYESKLFGLSPFFSQSWAYWVILCRNKLNIANYFSFRRFDFHYAGRNYADHYDQHNFLTQRVNICHMNF